MMINHTFNCFLFYFSVVKPEFFEEPRHVAIVLQGNNITLPCNVTGIPKPSISWLFSGGNLPASQQEEDGSLRIYLARNNRTYEGQYTCKATSIAGILLSNVTLTVDGKLFSLLIQTSSLTSHPIIAFLFIPVLI